MADQTLSFSEKVKGWTTFWSYSPQWMAGLNNKFFTFQNGQLYQHDQGSRGVFYGAAAAPSKLAFVFNDAPSEVKNFRTLEILGTDAWDATLTAYQSDESETRGGTIDKTEFVEREGIWKAHLRRHETFTTEGRNVYGIGEIAIDGGDILTFNTLDEFPTDLTVGDDLYWDNAGVATRIGAITIINSVAFTITVDTSVSNPGVGDFCFGVKNDRIEGSYLRGYGLGVALQTDQTTRQEIFAVKTEANKSYR